MIFKVSSHSDHFMILWSCIFFLPSEGALHAPIFHTAKATIQKAEGTQISIDTAKRCFPKHL